MTPLLFPISHVVKTTGLKGEVAQPMSKRTLGVSSLIATRNDLEGAPVAIQGYWPQIATRNRFLVALAAT